MRSERDESRSLAVLGAAAIVRECPVREAPADVWDLMPYHVEVRVVRGRRLRRVRWFGCRKRVSVEPLS